MKNISRLELENIYGKISPFEFKNKLIELATLSNRKSTRTLLDAGRGNPNWIASTPREAFFTFGQFAITESRYTWDDGDLTGMPKKTGIYKRFCTYVENNKFMPGIDTLKAIIDYGIQELNFDKDEFLHELTDAIIGDNYPFPDTLMRFVHHRRHPQNSYFSLKSLLMLLITLFHLLPTITACMFLLIQLPFHTIKYIYFFLRIYV